MYTYNKYGILLYMHTVFIFIYIYIIYTLCSYEIMYTYKTTNNDGISKSAT